MEIKDLKLSIKQNNIPKLLIFIGEECALCRQYLNRMSSTLNKYIKYYEEAKDLIVEITTNFKDDNLYVIFNDETILSRPDYIKTLSESNRNIVIYFTEFDRRSKFFFDNSNIVCDFKKLTKNQLIVYLNSVLDSNKIKLDQEKLVKLIDCCDCNLSICLSELNKLILLSQTSADMLYDYIDSNNFIDYKKVNAFTMISKIFNHDKTIYDDLHKIDESPIALLGMITRLAENRLSKLSVSDIDTSIYLGNIIKTCNELDCGIKDGTVNADHAIQYLLVKVL